MIPEGHTTILQRGAQSQVDGAVLQERLPQTNGIDA